MQTRYKVGVTEQHARQGRQCDSSECPITLAIKEATGFERVNTIGPVVFIEDERVRGVFQLPEICTLAVRRFDSRGTLIPFEFELDLEKRAEPDWSYGRPVGSYACRR